MLRLFLLTLFIILGSTQIFAENFKDLSEKHWAKASVDKIIDMKIVSGYQDGTFRGTKTVNRYDISVFLAKLAEFFENKIVKLEQDFNLTKNEYKKEILVDRVRLQNLEDQVAELTKFKRDLTQKKEKN